MFSGIALGMALEDLALARQLLRLRHLGHGDLVLESVLGDMERGRHGEDRHAMLDRHHLAGGEAAAVAIAVDLVDDRDGGIAGADEVTMQRMGTARAGDGAGCRDQGLADDLAAKDALPADLGLTPRNRLVSSGSRSRILRTELSSEAMGFSNAWHRRLPIRREARGRIEVPAR